MHPPTKLGMRVNGFISYEERLFYVYLASKNKSQSLNNPFAVKFCAALHYYKQNWSTFYSPQQDYIIPPGPIRFFADVIGYTRVGDHWK